MARCPETNANWLFHPWNVFKTKIDGCLHNVGVNISTFEKFFCPKILVFMAGDKSLQNNAFVAQTCILLTNSCQNGFSIVVTESNPILYRFGLFACLFVLCSERFVPHSWDSIHPWGQKCDPVYSAVQLDRLLSAHLAHCAGYSHAAPVQLCSFLSLQSDYGGICFNMLLFLYIHYFYYRHSPRVLN